MAPVWSVSMGTQPSTLPIEHGPKPSPLMLASSLPPVPAKLAKRIREMDFVEMRELLPDNIALSECIEALLSHSARERVTHQREIGSLLTWVSSFATYVAVISESHPERVPDMLMYLRLIVLESQKFNGMGWLTYDSVFHQNNAGGGSRWNVLDPSLHTAHIVQGGLRVIPCQICNGVDHSLDECAVAPLVLEVRPTHPRMNRVENRTASPLGIGANAGFLAPASSGTFASHVEGSTSRSVKQGGRVSVVLRGWGRNSRRNASCRARNKELADGINK